MNHRILIVDDDPDLAGTLVRLLGRLGHTCLSASTGDGAIALMDAELPHLIVTDLHLPGMDGLAVARHARAKDPPIPVILITAYPSAATHRQALEAGETIYLPKPFTTADLLKAVHRALEESSPPPPHS